MKWVNVKEARLLQQAIAKNDFRYLTLEEHAIVDKAYKAMKESELYNRVWKSIEDFANKLVDEKCAPAWKEISAKMQPLGEERNKLAKEKAEAKEWEWLEESETKLNEIDKELSDLSAEYNKVTDQANAELNEFKEKAISEEQWAAFLLEDDEYQLIGELVWRALPVNE